MKTGSTHYKPPGRGVICGRTGEVSADLREVNCGNCLRTIGVQRSTRTGKYLIDAYLKSHSGPATEPTPNQETPTADLLGMQLYQIVFTHTLQYEAWVNSRTVSEAKAMIDAAFIDGRELGPQFARTIDTLQEHIAYNSIVNKRVQMEEAKADE